MPQAIAAAAVTFVGATGVTATVISAVVQVAVVSGINVLAVKAFGLGPSVPKPSDIQKTIKTSVSSRYRHYGRVHVGGVLTFYESRDGVLYGILTFSQGEWEDIIEIRLNNKVATIDGSNYVTHTSLPQGGGYSYVGEASGGVYPMSVETKLGTDDQTHYSALASIFTEYTVNHRQRGCANALAIFRGVEAEDFGEVYEGGKEPALTVVADTTKIYDPRKDSTVTGGSGSHRVNDKSTWEYSKNAALCIADYLANDDGFGLGYDQVNWEALISEANISDEDVIDSRSRTIKRWQISGTYALADDTRKSVLEQMVAACDGFVFQDASGLVNIKVGKYKEPTIHIKSKHVISVGGNLGGDPQDAENEVSAVYVEPDLDYTEAESATQEDTQLKTLIGRKEASRYDLYFCPEHNQAARVIKRILKRNNNRWNLSLVLNLYGLNLIGERFVKVTLPELGINELVFEVNSFGINAPSNSITVELAQVKSTDFDLLSGEEGTPQTAPNTTITAPTTPAPTGLTVSTQNATVGTTSGTRFVISWTAPVGRDGLYYRVEMKLSSDSDWLLVGTTNLLTFNTSLVSESSSYDIRVRAISFFGRSSDWVESLNNSVSSSDSGDIPAPSGVSISYNTGDTRTYLTWTDPTHPDLDYFRIYRNTLASFNGATAVGTVAEGAEAFDHLGNSTGTTYYYYFEPLNVSTPQGGPHGPYTLVIA